MTWIFKSLKYGIVAAALAGLILGSIGCGTLIHPDRMGQDVTPKHRIDPGIVLLDGVALLFFVLPGLIAFVVDFSNRSIYVPPGNVDTFGTPNPASDGD